MHSNKGYQYKICKKYQLGTIDRAEYTATCIPQYTLMDNIVYMWDDFLNTCIVLAILTKTHQEMQTESVLYKIICTFVMNIALAANQAGLDCEPHEPRKALFFVFILLPLHQNNCSFTISYLVTSKSSS